MSQFSQFWTFFKKIQIIAIFFNFMIFGSISGIRDFRKIFKKCCSKSFTNIYIFLSFSKKIQNL